MNAWVIIGGVIAGVGAFLLLLWGLHRLCVWLEEQGFMYYRKRSESGTASGAVLMELDRLTRPTVEHVVEAQDGVRREVKEEVDGD